MKTVCVSMIRVLTKYTENIFFSPYSELTYCTYVTELKEKKVPPKKNQHKPKNVDCMAYNQQM